MTGLDEPGTERGRGNPVDAYKYATAGAAAKDWSVRATYVSSLLCIQNREEAGEEEVNALCAMWPLRYVHGCGLWGRAASHRWARVVAPASQV